MNNDIYNENINIGDSVYSPLPGCGYGKIIDIRNDPGHAHISMKKFRIKWEDSGEVSKWVGRSFFSKG